MRKLMNEVEAGRVCLHYRAAYVAVPSCSVLAAVIGCMFLPVLR